MLGYKKHVKDPVYVNLVDADSVVPNLDDGMGIGFVGFDGSEFSCPSYCRCT